MGVLSALRIERAQGKEQMPKGLLQNTDAKQSGTTEKNLRLYFGDGDFLIDIRVLAKRVARCFFKEEYDVRALQSQGYREKMAGYLG